AVRPTLPWGRACRLARRGCGFFVGISASRSLGPAIAFLSSCMNLQVRGLAGARERGAGERIRTTDLPFTRSTATCAARTTCADSTAGCKDGTIYPGLFRLAVPRSAPRREPHRVRLG